MKEQIRLIQSKEVQTFLEESSSLCQTDFILKARKKFPEISSGFLFAQIKGREMLKDKFSGFHEFDSIVYPEKISLEQSSSFQTSSYKQSFIDKEDITCDLTGGMGIDSYMIANCARQHTYNELNTELFDLVQYNFSKLNVSNTNFFNGSAEDFLIKLESSIKFDLTYIDPSRRTEYDKQQRIYNLEQCIPNVYEILGEIKKHSNALLIKASPMTNIQQDLKRFDGCFPEVHVIGVKNEVKEVLYYIDFNRTEGQVMFKAVDIDLNNNIESYNSVNFGSANQVLVSTPNQYIYEPLKVVMKAGLYDEQANGEGFEKLGLNTHLYTSNSKKTDYMGKVFEVIGLEKADRKSINKLIDVKNEKFNVVVKNFPMSVEEFCKKMKISQGGKRFLICFKDKHSKNVVALCERIK